MACGVIILAPCISAACLSHAVDAPCRPFKGLLFASYVHHADPLASLHVILASLLFLHYFSCPIRADLLPVENYRAQVKILILSSQLKITHSTIVCSTTEAILSCKMKASAGLHWCMSLQSNLPPALKGKT